MIWMIQIQTIYCSIYQPSRKLTAVPQRCRRRYARRWRLKQRLSCDPGILGAFNAGAVHPCARDCPAFIIGERICDQVRDWPDWHS